MSATCIPRRGLHQHRSAASTGLEAKFPEPALEPQKYRGKPRRFRSGVYLESAVE